MNNTRSQKVKRLFSYLHIDLKERLKINARQNDDESYQQIRGSHRCSFLTKTTFLITSCKVLIREDIYTHIFIIMQKIINLEFESAG